MTWAAIVIGMLLRLIDIPWPDMSTDEAQFAMGASAAQPPLGMALMRLSQLLMGHTLFAARLPSVLASLASIVALTALARHAKRKTDPLLVAAVAALIPSAIVFSRLAYLDSLLMLGWILTTLGYLQAAKDRTPRALALLWLTAMLTTFLKTQALLLPCALLAGHSVMHRRKVLRDPVAWMLLASVLPILSWIAVHPGIAATLVQNTGTTYGLSSPFARIGMWITTLWQYAGIALILCIAAVPTLRRWPWPVWALCALAVLQGLLLGPDHPYYVAALIVFALPAGSLLATLRRPWRIAVLLALSCSAIALTLPRWQGSVPLLRQEPVWNMWGGRMNELLAGTDAIVALGDPGHHLRWYLESEVLVGKDMDLHTWTGAMLLLPDGDPPNNRRFDWDFAPAEISLPLAKEAPNR